MNLSELSIKRPVFAWMLMIALIIFGSIYYQKLGISQLPDVDFPTITISANLQGATPEVVERELVDPLEGAVMTVSGVTNISSQASEERARVTVEFDLDKNVDTAVSEIESAISKAMRNLPDGIEQPVVSKSNPDDQPILWLAVSSKTHSLKELMPLVRNQVKDRFSTVPGVGEVFLGGYLEPNVRIWPSTKKMNQYELTSKDIVSAITAEHSEKPAGTLTRGDKQFNLRTLGEAESIAELENIVIGKRGGAVNYQPVRLRDVAKVEEGLEDITRLSRTKGIPAVGIGIKKQRGANSVKVADEVKNKIKLIQATLPDGVSIDIRFDSTTFIRESIRELNFTLIFSGILTALICWLFLGSFTATLNVILAIPTSIIGSFICLYLLGFTLNTFTLLGLSLAIGIVVDDAIMVLENIVRRREQGEGRVAAARKGATEITGAAIAATAAIVAIFLPVAFTEGIIGKFFFQFGVTISVAVLLSLLEALTLTPMRCSQFLTITKRTTWLGKRTEESFIYLSDKYKKILPILLRNRIKVILTSVAIFAVSILLVSKLPKEFTPAQDQGMLMLRVQTPVGSSFQYTNTEMKKLEEIINKEPNIAQYFATIGGSDVNSGMMFLTLKPRAERELSQKELSNKLRKQFSKLKNITVKVLDPSQMGMGSRRGYPIEFSIKGPDWNQLIIESKKMIELMKESKMVVDIDTDFKQGMPEIRFLPNREKAKQYGVTVSDISEIIALTLGGSVIGEYSNNGHRYDIRIKLPNEEISSPSFINNIHVRNNKGELVPLKNVITLVNANSIQSISRLERERAITLSANVATGYSQEEAFKYIQDNAKKTLSPDYKMALSGSSKVFKESFQALFMALLLGIMIAYMVLASQFNSFVHPFSVLMALPFSITGALFALTLTGNSLNLYSVIGIILLTGIVKKNSILLVDFTNQVRADGKNVHEALIAACPIRLRPILMTSIATIIGALPAAFAVGPGAESRSPMAFAVIGGVLVSTLLTLLVVPTVYSLLSPLEKKQDEIEVN